MAASDTIEAEGHLIDSGHLSAIFDKIIEYRAQHEILKFDIGRTNDDASRIEMRITATDAHQLDELLQQLTTWGCHPVSERDALVKPAEKRLLRAGRLLFNDQPPHAGAGRRTLDGGRETANGRGHRRPGRASRCAASCAT